MSAFEVWRTSLHNYSQRERTCCAAVPEAYQSAFNCLFGALTDAAPNRQLLLLLRRNLQELRVTSSPQDYFSL